MKKKIGMLFALFSMCFTIISLVSEDNQNEFFGIIANLHAQGPPPIGNTQLCFDRVVSNCQDIAGQNGGQRTVCDATGYYVAGAECTTVACFTGTQTKLVCKSLPPPQPPTN